MVECRHFWYSTRNHLRAFTVFTYINDLSECVSSTVKLYADDAKIYRKILDPIIDSQLLQADLNALTAKLLGLSGQFSRCR